MTKLAAVKERLEKIKNLHEDQRVGFAKWVMLTVAFGLTPYAFTVIGTGADPTELFGDGSLVLVGMGLVIAAGSTAIDDKSKIKFPWLWFGVLTIVLALTAAAFTGVKSDLREAELQAADIEIPSIREALRSQYLAELNAGQKYSAKEFDAIVRNHFASHGVAEKLSGEISLTDGGLAEMEDAIAALYEPVAMESRQREEAAKAKLEQARSKATVTGVLSLAVGLIFGSWVVLAVNRPSP